MRTFAVAAVITVALALGLTVVLLRDRDAGRPPFGSSPSEARSAETEERDREELIALAIEGQSIFDEPTLRLLTDEELLIGHPDLTAPRPPRPMGARTVDVRQLDSRSRVDPSARDQPYLQLPYGESPEVDSSLTPLVFLDPPRSGATLDTLRPTIRVAPVEADPGRVVNYYFEFDTTDSFDSPNLWRHPALKTFARPDDPVSELGFAYYLFWTLHRDVDSTRPEVRFPFRVSAMRLPHARLDIDVDEINAQAFCLGLGLDEMEAAEEIYNYVRYVFVIANLTTWRNPLDTFVTGYGECGNINQLFAMLLELNQIRSRGVGGFDPLVRTIYPGGGHGATEVFDRQRGAWFYADPFSSIFLPGLAAADFPDHPRAREILVYNIDNSRDHDVYGKSFTLDRLFAYRIYYDQPWKRLPVTNMFSVLGREHEYGLSWSLLDAAGPYEIDDLLPERLRVHVRARYVITDGQTVDTFYYNVPMRKPPKVVRVSAWSSTFFEVEPGALLAKGSS